jgi:hypothetical protein
MIFTVSGGRITAVNVIADPRRLGELVVEPLDREA